MKNTKQSKMEKDINQYCDKNEITIEEYYQLLFKESGLNKMDIQLFQTYSEYDASYRKTSQLLNGSRYIVNKEISRIKEILINTNNKILKNDN